MVTLYVELAESTVINVLVEIFINIFKFWSLKNLYFFSPYPESEEQYSH